MRNRCLILLLLLLCPPAIALTVVRSYYHILSEAETWQLTQALHAMGIDADERIRELIVRSHVPMGKQLQADIVFHERTTSKSTKQQLTAHCRNLPDDTEQWHCKPFVRNELLINEKAGSWVGLHDPFELPEAELLELVSYAQRVKPVSWPVTIRHISVRNNNQFSISFATDHATCFQSLHINRSVQDQNFVYQVDWPGSIKSRKMCVTNLF
jgi:hypothetical protein